MLNRRSRSSARRIWRTLHGTCLGRIVGTVVARLAVHLFRCIHANTHAKPGDCDYACAMCSLRAYASSGCSEHVGLFDALAKEAQERIDEFRPQAISTTVWAYTTLGHAAPGLFEAVERTVPHKLDDFSPQAFANTAWAFAKAGRPAPGLFDALAAAALPRLDRFSAQNLANFAWPFAYAGCYNRPLFEAIAERVVEHEGLVGCEPSNIAGLAWSFAVVEHRCPQLYELLADFVEERPLDFLPEAVSKTSWAFATMGLTRSSLYDALAAAVVQRLRSFSPQQLATTAWAFAKASFAVPRSWAFAGVWDAGTSIPTKDVGSRSGASDRTLSQETLDSGSSYTADSVDTLHIDSISAESSTS